MNDPYETLDRAFAALQAPLAFLDRTALDANIDAILDRAGTKPIRVASKSVRSIPVLRHIFARSEQFQGIMSFTPGEALFLIEQGFDDILLGYPTTDESAARQLAATGKQVTFMADHPAHCAMLNSVGEAAGTKMKVCLDLDMSVSFPGIYFGVYRSPLKSGDDVRRLMDQVNSMRHIQVVGLMGYEAQIAGLGDRPDGRFDLKTVAIALLKKQSIRKIGKRRRQVVEVLRQFTEVSLVNGGGTGSLESTREEDVVTEVTVGSGFYAPHLFDRYTQFRHREAAGFALPVVRIPKAGMVTCLGGGYLASGSADKYRLPKPWLPKNLSLIEEEGAGEVQTPLRVDGTNLSIGDKVFFRHAKAGELCERFNELHLLDDGRYSGATWKTYRGDGKCFL